MEFLSLIVPIFVLLLLGYVLRKLGFVDESFARQLNRVAYYVTLPVLLFTKTATVEPAELLHLPALVGFPLVIVAVTIVGAAAALLLHPSRRGAFVQAGFRANLAYLGLPIVVAAYGESSTAIAAVVVAVGTIAQTVASVVTLRLYHSSRGEVAQKLVGSVKNPLIIAIALGLLTATAEVRLPAVVSNTLELLARMSLPAILLVVGFSLSFTNLRESIAATGAAAFLKLIAMPVMAWLIVTTLFDTTHVTRAVIVLMAAMPTALTSQSFAREFGADEQLTAGTVSLSTLLMVITVPVTFLVLQTISNL